MVKISELFVIVYWMDWVGICLEGDMVYATKEEAEQKISALKETSYAVQRKIKYQVMSLDSYIYEERKQAAIEAKYPVH
jgi:uncharacterized protein YfcZ (UPF0381/DUF406 family)